MYIEKWNTIKNTAFYSVEGNDINGYRGKILDKENNVIYFMGIPQDNICFSYNYEQTKHVTENKYNELLRFK